MIAENIALSDAAKLLNLGPRKMIQALKARKILDRNRLPNWRYTQRGYFRVSTKSFNHPTRGLQHSAKTLVTPAGLEFLRREFAEQIEMEKAS
ncbi:phage antirepressor KilAC domain-containing protein [Marinobacter xestospongiae]|uniref:phage antirepressor KilAC domain-containing protein n=1 Tax=Marinobacter xestospongiae TaxID=994319 RepID=UPI002004EEDE|nr:phage antirepressor KilAC domain-containing protein [Marinobacter xestospongiae]MCK7568789.1 phage antirepressor KilAC domain-containing protein [Marinobacter xestospongiae]